MTEPLRTLDNRLTGPATRGMWTLLVLATLAPVPASPAGSVGAPPVEVTYLANEGFLLARGDTKVLIDALFPGIRGYPELPEEVRETLVAARPPFDGVDLALATHFHADHFGARELGGYLRAHPEVRFISTEQAIEALAESLGEAPARAEAIYPDEGTSASIEVDGASIKIFNLHHGKGGRPVQNLGFLVDLGGFRILHVGDTEVTAEEVRPLRLSEMGIDLALLPGWHLAEPHWLPVVAEIGATRVVAMHLATPEAPSSWFGSAGSRAERVRRILERYPDAWIPESPMETRSYAGGGADRGE